MVDPEQFDAISSFADPVFDTPLPKVGRLPAAQAVVPVELWGGLAFDLVLLKDNVPQILSAYNITETQLLNTINHDAFRNRWREAKTQVAELGPNAGFVLTARISAVSLVSELDSMAKDKDVAPAVRARAIEQIVRYARYDPAIEKPNQQANQSAANAVSVVFNIGGNLGSGLRGVTVDGQAHQEQ